MKGRCITDPAIEDANSAYERSLVFMHKVLPICFIIVFTGNKAMVFFLPKSQKSRYIYLVVNLSCCKPIFL